MWTCLNTTWLFVCPAPSRLLHIAPYLDNFAAPSRLLHIAPYLNGSAVGLYVDHVPNLDLLLLDALVDGRIQFQLLCALRRLQADNEMADSFTITCKLMTKFRITEYI